MSLHCQNCHHGLVKLPGAIKYSCSLCGWVQPTRNDSSAVAMEAAFIGIDWELLTETNRKFISGFKSLKDMLPQLKS